ncbi:MAG TPA: sigma-54-dependent Fis family transcriptional regulator, partial [Campylobacteraceae bacterium]|nr:sigma-54-dependent Fis family transcriptional regulator [Campylobacteraceae bacterium]
KIDSSFEIIITDITMPRMNGLEFIKEIHFPTNIIIMTGNATLNTTIEAIRFDNVKDFLTKPFEIGDLVSVIERVEKVKEKKEAYEKRYITKDRRVGEPDTRKIKVERRKQGSDRRKKFYGSSEKLEKIKNTLQKAAKTDASIMLLGESGVGKELFARYIHEASPRYAGPFIAINMAAIPENLLESELFGYEKGAFTDATAQKIGHFESAHKGTLFLDEIGEMPPALQAKLLRVIQEREIVRVGGTKPTRIDVRIVSATNVNITEKIKNKQFREDLYYRLNTIPVKIAPLRERKEEILDIATEYLYRTCRQYDLPYKQLSDGAKEELLAYDWPGNIRELRSVIERAVILSDGEMIEPEDLGLDIRIGAL